MKKKQSKEQLREEVANQKRKEKFRREITPLVLSFILWLALVSVVHLDWADNAIARFFIDVSVWSTYIFGKITFIPVTMHDRLITVIGFPMKVVPSCTIYEYYLLVISIVVFARWTWKSKLANAGIMIGILFVLNIVRFIIMGFVGKYFHVAFETAHDYFWNIMFAIVALGLWAWCNDKSKIEVADIQKK